MTAKSLLAFLFLACSILVAPHVVAAEATPFQGTLEGAQTVTPLENTPFLFIRGKATGNATQLGQFSVDMPHIVNGAAATGRGSLVFTAANGDTIIADFNGRATETSPGVVAIVENAVITGGTGRFAGATGTIRFERSFDFATNLTKGSFVGVIAKEK